MASIKSINKKHNDYFLRTEGIAIIEFDKTISINDAKQLLIKNLAVENEALVEVLDLNTKFGKHTAEVVFEAYDNAEAMEKVKVMPKKVRDKMKEEAKKAYEEKKKQLEEQKKAEEEAEVAAAAEAEKPAEEPKEEAKVEETKEEVKEEPQAEQTEAEEKKPEATE